MVLWWCASAMGAAPPTVDVAWRKERAVMRMTAPDGHELQPDGPADLALTIDERPVEGLLVGASLAAGLPLGDVRGSRISGQVSVVLCHKESGVCTRSAFDVAGEVPQAKRGTASLDVGVHRAEASRAAFGPDATSAAADAAFARAQEIDGLVLLDFSAVWCPPCVVLAAEVLHAEPAPVELDGMEVAVVDVDHPSSFALKDRYDVGGYPTVVVADAEGNELTRMVGYPGRDAFLAWLGTAAESTDASDLEAGPDAVSPERAAALALRLAQARKADEAKPWIERAEQASPPALDAVLAKTLIEPSADGVAWLADNAPERAYDWAFTALDLDGEHAALKARAAALAVAHTQGSELGDALYLAGKVEPDEEQAKLLFAAAASATASWMEEHPESAKSAVGWLARLRWMSGAEDDADEILQQAAARYPDEPTFELARADLWLERDPATSLAAATAAHDRAWGDNRLRTASAMASALSALGRDDEAAAVARAALEASQLDPELDVRTHRYRTRLQAWLGEEG
ncbi:MAG: thioredoxin family protein [Myxococcales bacterium]|nr:thioredoxin family protein [Myxococcales bacterium]